MTCKQKVSTPATLTEFLGGKNSTDLCSLRGTICSFCTFSPECLCDLTDPHLELEEDGMLRERKQSLKVH